MKYMYWIIGLLGLALVLAPFVLNFDDNNDALWSSIILGIVILAVSAYKALAQDVAKWEYWLAGIAGILAIIAPFVLGFSSSTERTEMWTSIVLGGVVVVLAAYVLFRGGGQQQLD